ncbi:TetR/AcrR family transcriptional regulator [Paeniglutamicibacter psychrophenolicus]|uniref:AcrR family transcriptional regulator n=2 Tax=Paeniglutamicibacter psychrophenolicus TaxID=257454 RepID=A0ABS4WFM3_9MICC|nr:TetR/AcrR family transcriptional regulator [Paeniglutamicibacter psychrophenolicus]MBP2374998.1 AcrR family transcriptional regulator [Paeniglutamicibacter psychrophenolicus]
MESTPRPKPNRRAQQSAETSRLIISTARRLFMERGFVPTTVEKLARECGVAVQTIYNSVGNKTQILSRIIDQAASGERAPASPLEFLAAELERTTTPDDVATVLSAWFADVNGRMAPVYKVLSEAAAVDPAAASLQRARDAQRFERYLATPGLLRDRGGLQRGQDDEDVAALIWNTGHPETYRFLVAGRGWSSERYERWCHATLAGAFS